MTAMVEIADVLAILERERPFWPITPGQIAYTLRRERKGSPTAADVSQAVGWAYVGTPGTIPAGSVAVGMVTAPLSVDSALSGDGFVRQIERQISTPHLLRQRSQTRYVAFLTSSLGMADFVMGRLWGTWSVPAYPLALPMAQDGRAESWRECVIGEAVRLASADHPVDLLVLGAYDVKAQRGVLDPLAMEIAETARAFGADVNVYPVGVTEDHAAMAETVVPIPATIGGRKTQIIEPDSLPIDFLAGLVIGAAASRLDLELMAQEIEAIAEEESEIVARVAVGQRLHSLRPGVPSILDEAAGSA